MRIQITAAIICMATVSLPVLADNQRPSVVKNIRGESVSGPAIIVSWSRPWDNVGVDGYNIYRNGSYYTTVRSGTTYIDRTVSSGRDYRYAVVAFDRARNYSTMSGSASARSGGSSSAPTSAPPTSSGKPQAPSNVRASVRDSRSVKLSWSTPSGGADGYNVYKDGKYYTTVKGRNDYTAGSLNNSKTYSFYVVAFRNKRYSTKSAVVKVRTSGSSNAPTQADPPSVESDNSAVPSGYKLVFSDDFKRGNVDSSKWNTRYRWGPDWVINGEQQHYIDTLNRSDYGISPFINDGNRLTIRATRTPARLRDKARKQPYLSGAITTHRKFRMKYGYVEMRARLPGGKGLWPAFWLLHEASDRRRPEIDVMEMLGENPRLVYQTYHYYDRGNLRSTPSFKAAGPDYSKDFHTFGMLWEPGRITWYVDGRKTNRHESGNVSDEYMYLLVNLAVGGNWGGSPNSSTRFPADYVIDYVRAWQKR